MRLGGANACTMRMLNSEVCGVTFLHIVHAQKESRGKYKKLEHSNEIYFPTQIQADWQ